MTESDTAAAVHEGTADDNTTETEPSKKVRGGVRTGPVVAATAAGITPSYSAFQVASQLGRGQVSGASRLADMVAKSDTFAQVRALRAVNSSMTRALPPSTFGKLFGASRTADTVAKAGAFSHLARPRPSRG